MNKTRKKITSGDSTDEDMLKISSSKFYKSARLTSGGDGTSDELVIDTHKKLNIREKGRGFVKSSALVLLSDGEWKTERTPVFDKTTYRFPIESDGAYTVVATGSATNGQDFPVTIETETILELTVEDGKVSVEGVYYTQKREVY
ncbi:hypothetical protein C440_06127 [Haloferax mucosum ATCC BAA-1512]|uniref:Uncharacterized protein n=2 Tax=Haloferax mucosum TaxID=403181 RepID=M0IK54_9EURY|nr:hypothetical protein C440_06127 [Haloferax mucosum ATCC BAA-1512]